MSQLKITEALKCPEGKGTIPTGIEKLDASLGGGLPKHDLTMVAGLGPNKDEFVECVAISLARSGCRVIFAGLSANDKVNATLSLLEAGAGLGLSLHEMTKLPIELLDGEWDCVTLALLNETFTDQMMGGGEDDVVLIVDSATMLDGAHSITETVAALKGIAYGCATLVAAVSMPYAESWLLEDAGAVVYVDDSASDREEAVSVVKAPRSFLRARSEGDRAR